MIIEVFLRQKKKLCVFFWSHHHLENISFFLPPPAFFFFQLSRILLLTVQSWEPHSSCRVKLSSYKLGKGRICCLFFRPLNFEGRLVLLPLFGQFDLWSWKSGHSFPGQRKKDEGVVSRSKYLIKNTWKGPADLDRDTQLFQANLIEQSENFIRGKCSLPGPSSMDEPFLSEMTDFMR